jgi:hypothetical protein
LCCCVVDVVVVVVVAVVVEWWWIKTARFPSRPPRPCYLKNPPKKPQKIINKKKIRQKLPRKS